jgi:hypothetical protein
MPNNNIKRLDRGIKDTIQTVKDYAPVAKGVAKTFLTGGTVSGKPEEEVDFGPGPTPKAKTPPPPSQWYKESSEHKIPSYKEGTNYVPKTGPAILHEGEAVVPKEKNMAKAKNPSLYRALHKLKKGGLHRALGVPEGETISEDKLQKARNSSNPHVAKMANFAHTMKGWKH